MRQEKIRESESVAYQGFLAAVAALQREQRSLKLPSGSGQY